MYLCHTFHLAFFIQYSCGYRRIIADTAWSYRAFLSIYSSRVKISYSDLQEVIFRNEICWKFILYPSYVRCQEGDEAPCFFCKRLRLKGKDTAPISFSYGPAFQVSLLSVIQKCIHCDSWSSEMTLKRLPWDVNISLIDMWHMQNKGPTMHSCFIIVYRRMSALGSKKNPMYKWVYKSEKA